MIDPSMSKLEICNALFDDLPKIKMRIELLEPRIIKHFKKEKKFPSWKWEEYTHQESKNKYLISFYASSPHEASKPSHNYVAILKDGDQRIVVQWGCWFFRERGHLEATLTRYVGFFCDHFFDRYRERVWGETEMTFNELVSRYFSRNIDTIPLELNENIQRKYKKYGELARYAFKVPEGICFIRHWNEGDLSTIGHENSNFISIVLYYTFVNEGMMSETQTKAIHNEKTRYLREYYNNLLDDVIKEAFPLTLNLPNKDDKELNENMEQMISMEECEQMGSHTEDKIFNNVISKLNERHQSSTGLTYFDQLSIDLTQGGGILKDAFPEAHAEILSLMHEEYRALDELEQHCLFLYLFTNDRDEGEIVDSMYYHFEDWMEERAYDFLNQAKNGAPKN